MSQNVCVDYEEAKKVHSIAYPTKQRHQYGFFMNIILKFQAKIQARKIIKGLNEAKKIHAGYKKGKSFDEFIKEI